MIMKKIYSLICVLFLASGLMITGCDNGNDPTAQISFNESGDTLGGDVTGNGGTKTLDYAWTNSLTTADWNMDITATVEGSLRLLIRDADGNTVLDQTLSASSPDDSGSGVTSSGTAGNWTVTVTVTNFNGDGSFSLSPGN